MSNDKVKNCTVTEPGYDHVIAYLREKINQLLVVMGTLPLRTEELDDETLISVDPLGILADSFSQVLDNHQNTNKQLELANEEISAIIDAVGAAIIVVDKNFLIELYNKQSLDLFKTNDDQTNKYLCDSLDQKDNNIPPTVFDDISSEGKSVRKNNIYLNDSYYDLIATPLKNSQGEVFKIILMFFDNTERILTEDQLHLASIVFDNTAEGVIVTDENKSIIAVNDSLLKITGYEREELIGQVPSVFRSDIYDNDFYSKIKGALDTSGHWNGDTMDRRKNGEYFPVNQTISVVKRDDGSIRHYVSIMSDITEQKEYEEQLDFLAHHDQLTSLPNRVLFQERLNQSILKAERNNTRVGVVFADLDRFKNINDTLGHAIGDKLLVKVANRLTKYKRSSDTVARLGGDEFIFLLDGSIEARGLAIFCEKLLSAFEKPFKVDDFDLYLTLSMGICFYPDDGRNVDTLIKNADAAMYMTKEMGKNGYHFFTRELSKKVSEKLKLENDLRKAIEDRQFELYYQPQFALYKDEMVSVEALIRWNHPELGIVQPCEFIPLAEETGLILKIGDWVINEACQQLKLWRQNGLNLDHIAVNVSGLQISRGDLVNKISSALKKHSLNEDDLEIEITESAIMGDMAQAINILGYLKNLGITIAIDDFGTGYSSLGYLNKLPIDKIKIDRSFIHEVEMNRGGKAMVLAIIAMAKNLKLDIVAEGVETQTQHDFLIVHGCEYAQGYLYSKPLSVKNFESYFKQMFNKVKTDESRSQKI